MSPTDGPPDLPYPKLPFWNTVRLSYSTYFSQFIDVLRASWLWLLVVAAFTAFASWQQWSWMAIAITNLNSSLPPQVPKPTEMDVLLALDNILMTFAGVSIAIAWHRLMILNEQPGFSGSNVTTGNLWRYIVMAAVLFLPTAIMLPVFYFLLPESTGRMQLPPGSLPIAVIVIVAYLAGFAAALRLTLLLPARAVGNTALTFKQAWNRTGGNVWRLIGGLVATTTPALWIAQLVFGLGTTAPFRGIDLGEAFAARMTAMSTLFVVYSLLILPIGIGFLSHAYRHFFVGR